MKLFNPQLSIILWIGIHNQPKKKKNENLETHMV